MPPKTQSRDKQQQKEKEQRQGSDESFEEANHWKDVMRTLLHYEDFIAVDLNRRQEHLNRLPQKWADKLPSGTFSKLEGTSSSFL